MRHLQKIISLSAIITILTTVALHAFSSTNNNEQKARYYYLAGTQQVALQNFGEALELFEHAYRLNPKSPEIGLAYAKLHYDEQVDSTQAKQLLALFRRYNDAYPQDLFEAKIYAEIASEWGNNPAEAARVLEQVIARNPADTDIYFILARHYADIDSIPKAMNVLDRYERLEGEDIKSTSQRVLLYFQHGDTISAINTAQKFAHSHPQNPDSWILRGALSQTLGQKDSVLTFYSQAEALQPENSSIKMELAKYYFQAADTTASANKLSEFMKGTDIDADTKLQQIYEFDMGLMMARHSRTWLAQPIETLLASEPHTPDILNYAAAFYESIGKSDKSILLIKELYQLEPSNPATLEGLLYAYFKADRFNDLANTFESLHSDTTLSNNIYLMATYAYQQLSQQQKAINLQLAQARKYIPSYTPQLSKEQFTKEIDSIATLDINNKNNALLWVRNLGDSYILAGDTTTAMQIYQQAITADPTDPLTLNNYAYYLSLTNQQLDYALSLAEKAINADPENPTYIDTYAYILFKQKDFSRAELYQKMAIDKAASNAQHPTAAEYYDHYGDILFMLGNTPEAILYWQKALDMEPNNQLIKKKVETKAYIEK